jgi:hypothetical protein
MYLISYLMALYYKSLGCLVGIFPFILMGIIGLSLLSLPPLADKYTVIMP